MSRFDQAAPSLVLGQTVRVTVAGHRHWGVGVVVDGLEDVGASVDAALIDSPSGAVRALPSEYPPVGTETDAVVQDIRRYWAPAWIRLSLRAADLAEFSAACGLCGLPTVLSTGGDGVSVDVRSADGPGATTFGVHRNCLIDRLHPAAVGEHARVATVGHLCSGEGDADSAGAAGPPPA